MAPICNRWELIEHDDYGATATPNIRRLPSRLRSASGTQSANLIASRYRLSSASSTTAASEVSRLRSPTTRGSEIVSIPSSSSPCTPTIGFKVTASARLANVPAKVQTRKPPRSSWVMECGVTGISSRSASSLFRARFESLAPGSSPLSKTSRIAPHTNDRTTYCRNCQNPRFVSFGSPPRWAFSKNQGARPLIDRFPNETDRISPLGCPAAPAPPACISGRPPARSRTGPLHPVQGSNLGRVCARLCQWLGATGAGTPRSGTSIPQWQ